MNTAYVDLSDARIAAMRKNLPDLFQLPLQQRLKRWLWAGLLLGVVLLSFWKMDFSLLRCWQGLAKLGWLFQFLFPPAHHGWLGVFAYALLETIAMAFLGTLLACLAAVPLGFLGAKNVLSNRGGHFLIRRSFDFMRGIDALIWALVFISVVGLGPFAGVLAIAFSDVGVLGKLFAEAIENVEKDQVEGIRSTGAGPIQVMRFGIFPQIFPVL
ncbi:MAG: ABC transporter permease subunit, partial [Desulfobacteraceae bacterium]